MRDVTKTKPSHYAPQRAAASAPVIDVPTTAEGMKLAKEVGEASNLSTEAKAKLIRSIVDYEATHGQCSLTFSRKLRKAIRPASS